MEKEQILDKALELLFQVSLRSFMDGSKQMCKMPLTLRNQIDEFLKECGAFFDEKESVDQRIIDTE